MALTYLTGNDGSISLPSAHGAQLQTWNATWSRQASDVTGYGDTGRRRRLGIWDITGSAGGTLIADSANAGPGVDHANIDGAAITLQAYGTACQYVVTAVMSQVAIGITKTGDATISFDFQVSNGTIPTETWDEGTP
jgi:hypothetical protein